MKTKESFLFRPHFSRQLEPKLDVGFLSALSIPSRSATGTEIVDREGEFIWGETIVKLYYCKRLDGLCRFPTSGVTLHFDS
jgi:hypothetical protein